MGLEKNDGGGGGRPWYLATQSRAAASVTYWYGKWGWFLIY